MQRHTKQQVEAARGGTIPDVIAPDLRVLFCGINPSLYSAATGHHFARPGNRFWPALHKAGFTDRRLSPDEGHRLTEFGCGLTNLVDEATARADELSAEALRSGAATLEAKVRRYEPGCVAFVGVTAYRTAFGRPDAVIGPSAHRIGEAGVWVLPSTSGLNAHHQLGDLAKLFAELKRAAAS